MDEVSGNLHHQNLNPICIALVMSKSKLSIYPPLSMKRGNLPLHVGMVSQRTRS